MIYEIIVKTKAENNLDQILIIKVTVQAMAFEKKNTMKTRTGFYFNSQYNNNNNNNNNNKVTLHIIYSGLLCL